VSFLGLCAVVSCSSSQPVFSDSPDAGRVVWHDKPKMKAYWVDLHAAVGGEPHSCAKLSLAVKVYIPMR